MDRVQKVVRKILREAPGSTRELGRAAKVSHRALTDVRNGRKALGTARLRDVVRALRRWSRTCERLAADLEEALDERDRKETQGE